MSPNENRELAQNRPFLVLLIARTISMLGIAFSPIALAFGVLRLPGGNAGTLSAVLTAESLPMVVFMLIGGVIADRYPRALVLLAGEWLSALAWALIGAMMLTGWVPLWGLILAAALAGISGSAIYPALNGIIPDLVPEHLRQQGNAWLAMGASGARLAGLIAGGAVVVWLGGGWAMMVAGAFFALAGVFVLALPRTRGTLADASESPLQQLISGWGEFRSRQWLWVVVVQWSIIVMVLQAAHGVLGPVVAETELGGPAAWTVILAGEALGAVVGVGIALFWKPRRPILVGTLLTSIAAIPALLLGFSFPVWMVVIAAFLMGIGFDLFGVLWMTTMQNEVPPESLARVSSYDALGSMMLAPLGLVLAGPAVLLLGIHQALIVTGVVTVVATGLALLSPEVRHLESRQHSQVELAPLPEVA